MRLPECVSIRFWSSLKDMAAQADAVWWSGGRRQKWTGPAWTRESRGNGVWAHGLLAGWGPFEMIVGPHPSCSCGKQQMLILICSAFVASSQARKLI